MACLAHTKDAQWPCFELLFVFTLYHAKTSATEAHAIVSSRLSCPCGRSVSKVAYATQPFSDLEALFDTSCPKKRVI